MGGRLVRDLRLALRGFRRAPAFAAAVVAILALGIGVSAAMFTTAATVLARRLPVTDQDRLAVLWTYDAAGTELPPESTTLPELRASSRTMRGVAGVAHWGAAEQPYLDGDATRRLQQGVVTANYFAVLGARPALGRLLRAEDGAAGAAPVMVLSYGAWRTRFGGSRDMLGRKLVDPYSHRAYAVVGVAAPGLDYPVGTEAWIPIVEQGDLTRLRVLAVARLAPGASLDAARGEYRAAMAHQRPDWHLTGATAVSFERAMLGDARPVLVALTTAIALLLLIACVNVGTLFLARALGRSRELAVRRALGASYGELVRQLVAESAVLAGAGGLLGVVCAAAAIRLFVAAAPVRIPRLDEVRLHAGLLGVAFGVTALAVLLFGVLPSLAAARLGLASPLRHDARAGNASRRRSRVRDLLVASQVALALVLLAGAALVARSLARLERLDLGFRAEHLAVVSIAPDAGAYQSGEAWDAMGDRLETRVAALPGVSGVTPLITHPFDGPTINVGLFEGEGQTAREVETSPATPWEVGGTQYFATLGIPVVRGRAFDASDRRGAPPVAVVSASVARRLWPGQDPLGKRLRWAPSRLRSLPGLPPDFFDWRTVVGVVPDTRFRTVRETTGAVYLPWRQNGWPGTLLAVRTTLDLPGLTTALRRVTRDVGPGLTLWRVESLDDALAGPLAEPRMSAVLFGGFALGALALAAVGLFGVVASGVRERTREIGVRMALGATPALIRGAVLRRALAVAGAGAAVGLAGALLATRVLRSLLFEVRPADPLALSGACALLLVAVLAAALVPARRATRVDPARALRAD